MKVPCEACNGNGSIYTRIACDIHIATCPECEGLGVVEAQPTIIKKKAEPYKSFGVVDIDSILRGE